MIRTFMLSATSWARLRDERGASLVEYTLLVAFIALVCVAAVSALGGATGEPLSAAGSRVAN